MHARHGHLNRCQRRIEKGLNLEELSEEEKRILRRLKELGSIRAVAMELGGLNKRYIVRKILRKIIRILKK